MNKSLFRILTVFALAIALAVPVAAFARGGGRRHPGERMDQMLSQLSLTTEQQTLLDAMKSSHRSFVQAERADREEMEQGRKAKGRRGGIKFHREFNDECSKNSPDFASVAADMKAQYPGQNTDAFAAAVNATVAFYASLDPDQRNQHVELHEQMRANRGHRGGKSERFQE